MNNFTLRSAVLEDLETLLEFEQNIITVEREYDDSLKEGKISYYDLKELILAKSAEVVVVEYDNKIVGSGFAEIRESKSFYAHDYHSYLGFMYVDGNYRGQGVNKLILDSLKQWSKDNDITYFSLDVYAENKAAIKAYEKVGFKNSLIEMTMSLD